MVNWAIFRCDRFEAVASRRWDCEGYAIRMRWTAFLALTCLACAAGTSLAGDNQGVDPRSRAQDQEQVRACRGLPDVTVRASEEPETEAVCEGAGRALAFLAGAGLNAPPHTRIEILSELPGELAGRAVGCYVRETQRVLILSFGAFQAGGGWFQMPPSWELYRAAASHEVAHAVVGCHSEPRRLAVAAHEYVAYVVFFATMDAQLRAALLAKFPGAGFRTAGQISDISHMVNPNQFGVDSWRHYTRVRDGGQWLRKIIAGEVVPEPADDPGASSR